MRRAGIRVAALLGLVCFRALPAFGGGIQLYEVGTPDVGLASAGYAARAEDAATLFKNPAGMSLLEGSELELAPQVLYGSVRFSSNGNTTTNGGDGGNAVGWFPGGGMYVVVKPTEDLGLGFGTFSYFGLAQDYDDGWVGRYYYESGGLLGLSLMPTVSYRLVDGLSIGAGLNAMYGMLEQKTAINNVIGPDGEVELRDQTWGFGATAGVLIEPVKGTRIGVTYLSPVDLDFKDTPAWDGLGPGLDAVLGAAGLLNSRIDLGMTVPQSVMLSAYQDLSDTWAIMADFGWQDWSEFGKVDVSVDTATPTSLTTDLNYQDTYHGAVGVRCKFLADWAATLGFAYDSSAVSDSDRTVSFPVGEAYRIGTGIQWKVSKAIELGAAYEFLWGGNMSVDQERGPLSGRVAGEFENTAFHFVALNLSWRF